MVGSTDGPPGGLRTAFSSFLTFHRAPSKDRGWPPATLGAGSSAPALGTRTLDAKSRLFAGSASHVLTSEGWVTQPTAQVCFEDQRSGVCDNTLQPLTRHSRVRPCRHLEEEPREWHRWARTPHASAGRHATRAALADGLAAWPWRESM